MLYHPQHLRGAGRGDDRLLGRPPSPSRVVQSPLKHRNSFGRISVGHSPRLERPVVVRPALPRRQTSLLQQAGEGRGASADRRTSSFAQHRSSSFTNCFARSSSFSKELLAGGENNTSMSSLYNSSTSASALYDRSEDGPKALERFHALQAARQASPARRNVVGGVAGAPPQPARSTFLAPRTTRPSSARRLHFGAAGEKLNLKGSRPPHDLKSGPLLGRRPSSPLLRPSVLARDTDPSPAKQLLFRKSSAERSFDASVGILNEDVVGGGGGPPSAQQGNFGAGRGSTIGFHAVGGAGSAAAVGGAGNYRRTTELCSGSMPRGAGRGTTTGRGGCGYNGRGRGACTVGEHGGGLLEEQYNSSSSVGVS